MKRTLVIIISVLILTALPLIAVVPKAEYETETDIPTDTAETEDTESVFTADVSFDGEDQVGETFEVSVFAVAEELRGGVMTVSYDTTVLSVTDITLSDEEGLYIRAESAPGSIRVVFITDDMFYGVMTLFTVGFSVVEGAWPENVQISLADIVITDGENDTVLSGVTYTAAYVPTVTADTGDTDTAATDTDAPDTVTDEQTEAQTEPVTAERVTEPSVTEAAGTDVTTAEPETQTGGETSETEPSTEGDETSPATSAGVTETGEKETATETEAVITPPLTQSEPTSTEGEEEKRDGPFLIPAVIAAAALAFAAGTAVYFIKKRKV